MDDYELEPRTYLEPWRGKSITVEGVFERWGFRKDRQGEIKTALFQNVTHEGNVVCTHLHVQNAENLNAYDPRPGDRIRFTGDVLAYRKNLPTVRPDGVGVITQYGLWNPRGISVLNRVVKLPSLVEDTEEYDEEPDREEEPPPAPPPPPPAPPAAGKAALVRAVEEAGTRWGWDAVTEVVGLCEQAGADRVRKAVQFLRD
jgi:hypothetical protein